MRSGRGSAQRAAASPAGPTLGGQRVRLHAGQWAAVGWPMFLMLVGGAVGGAIGAGAAALNYRIITCERTAVFRYGACFLVGAGAIVAFLLAVLALYLMVPGGFGGEDPVGPIG